MFDPRLSRGKLIRCKVSWNRRCPVTYTNMVQWSIGMWRRLQSSSTQMSRGCTYRKWGEEVRRSVTIGLSVEFCSNSSKRRWKQRRQQQMCVGGGKNLNPALFLFFSPKALCFFMLMMTIAWHRDLVQTGKVRFQIFLHPDLNNHLFTLFEEILFCSSELHKDVFLDIPLSHVLFFKFKASYWSSSAH